MSRDHPKGHQCLEDEMKYTVTIRGRLREGQAAAK